MSNASRIAALAHAAVLASLAFSAQAQVYKCAQSGGSTTYQSTPCPVAGKPSAHPTLAQLNAAQRAADAKARDSADPYSTSVGSRPRAPGPQAPSVVEPPRKAVTQQTATEEDRHKACTIALSNQVVLARGRQVYTYDNTGNKQYIPDSDRSAAQTRSRQSEARNCN
ncbi:MAG: hypothetical protein ABIR54_12415 [Burkholderiaceae bacterium]|jgi:hypothetical protein